MIEYFHFLGLDYISQEDVLPYGISDIFSRPIHHELFDKFLFAEPKRGNINESHTCLYVMIIGCIFGEKPYRVLTYLGMIIVFGGL